MKFGVQFFPDVKPQEKSAADYFRESLAIVEAAEPLGYAHVRTVEHHLHFYGGYSPNPVVFLAAASQRTKQARLITGAIIPAWNHPLKIAGEIAMLDAISGGRLEVGFARAFLPHEFTAFGISPDDSIARFREGMEQVDLLLREENVTHHGRFYSFDNVTVLPRPTQQPRPKFFVAATTTPESFQWAGRMGYSLMSNPAAGHTMRELIGTYRQAWREAGHPGNGEVMLAFHMFVERDGARARQIAKPHVEAYFEGIYDATRKWSEGFSSKDYRGYGEKSQRMHTTSFEAMVESGNLFIGSPAEVRDTIARFNENVGGFEHASLQINFHTLPAADAMRSLELFAKEVIPAFAS